MGYVLEDEAASPYNPSYRPMHYKKKPAVVQEKPKTSRVVEGEFLRTSKDDGLICIQLCTGTDRQKTVKVTSELILTPSQAKRLVNQLSLLGYNRRRSAN